MLVLLEKCSTSTYSSLDGVFQRGSWFAILDVMTSSSAASGWPKTEPLLTARTELSEAEAAEAPVNTIELIDQVLRAN